MGSLLAWLQLPCDGRERNHFDAYKPAALPLEDRQRARAYGRDLGTLGPCFDMERPPRAGEEDEPAPLA